MNKKQRLVKKLAKALHLVHEGNPPTVTTEGDGWPYTGLLWEEGPYEWTSVTGGCSLYSGERGTYGAPTEPSIQAVFDEIYNAGLFLEPVNHYSVAIYEAQ